jgi:hypothetical protein
MVVDPRAIRCRDDCSERASYTGTGLQADQKFGGLTVRRMVIALKCNGHGTAFMRRPTAPFATGRLGVPLLACPVFDASSDAVVAINARFSPLGPARDNRLA